MYGFTQSRDVVLSDTADLVNTSRYIAKYCSKSLFEHPHVNAKVLPTFHLVSKGLGIGKLPSVKDYVLSNKDNESILIRSKLNINGFEYSLPKYYKEKIFGQKSLLRSRIADYLALRNDKLYLAQLQELQSQSPNDSAFRILDLQNMHNSSTENSKLLERHLRFYNKSQI